MAQCLKPYLLKTNQYVPCGKCENCKKRIAGQWGLRLLNEAELYSSAFFVTLTYDAGSVTITKNGYMTLVKKDVQNFMKALRKRTKNKIKFFAVGEYGGHRNRPHYHILLLNCPIEAILKEKENGMLKIGTLKLDGKHNIYINGWEKGYASIGHLEPASVNYTLKYISKEKEVPRHKNDDRQPEFRLMSKKLGLNYIDKYWKVHFHDKLRQYAVTPNGIKIALPRYLKERLYTLDERELVSRYYSAKNDERIQKLSYKQLVNESKAKRNKASRISKKPENGKI